MLMFHLEKKLPSQKLKSHHQNITSRCDSLTFKPRYKYCLPRVSQNIFSIFFILLHSSKTVIVDVALLLKSLMRNHAMFIEIIRPISIDSAQFMWKLVFTWSLSLLERIDWWVVPALTFYSATNLLNLAKKRCLLYLL